MASDLKSKSAENDLNQCKSLTESTSSNLENKSTSNAEKENNATDLLKGNKDSPKNIQKYTEETIDKFKITTSTDDEDEDDVPGDFFDDFLKEDFMAGLDIVDDDEWDEEKEQEKKCTSIEKEKEKDTNQETTKKQTEVTITKSVDNQKCGNDIKKKKKITNDSQTRRDPKKTRRDIEFDKARCEKDRAKKLISEKLKLVETGLIPPGMEMETDIESITLQKKQLEMPNISNISLEATKKYPKMKITPRGVQNSKLRSRSPMSKTRSPVRRTRSPMRRTRSPMRRTRSPRQRSRSTRRRSRSPRRISRSPQAVQSIRHTELLIRKRILNSGIIKSLEKRSPSYRRHRRTRSRSRSAKRRRDEKKSFLQEISEKLNEVRPVTHYPTQIGSAEMYNIGSHINAPCPVPAPISPSLISTQYPTPTHGYDLYDRNFFIGSHMTQNTFNVPNPLNIHSTLPNLMPTQPIEMPIQQQNTFTQHLGIPFNLDQTAVQNDLSTQPQEEVQIKEDINKLFQDKQISLTDFLAVTAKSEAFSASPPFSKEKIKVIARCQEALKYLENSEKKYSGPLIVSKSMKTKTFQEKMKSPLLKSSRVKFAFTEVPDKSQQRSEFTTFVNKFVDHLGLVKDVIVIDDGSSDLQTTEPSPPPAPSMSKNRVDFGSNRLSKFIQTDQFRCDNCEKRNKITYQSTGAQCSEEPLMFSVGTQVREDDFYAKIPKNQSLASLTPAQLLARSNSSMSSTGGVADDFDTISSRLNRQPYTSKRYNSPEFPPPPPRGINFNAPPRYQRW